MFLILGNMDNTMFKILVLLETGPIPTGLWLDENTIQSDPTYL